MWKDSGNRFCWFPKEEGGDLGNPPVLGCQREGFFYKQVLPVAIFILTIPPETVKKILRCENFKFISNLDAILEAASSLGPVTIQARKTYVSLVSPRRTFARVQPTTKNRVDLGLRLEGIQPGGRLGPSKIHETTPLQISLTSLDEVDTEVLDWLQQAYDQNC